MSTDDDRGVGHARDLAQQAFDLGDRHPAAADLDDAVGAPEQLEAAAVARADAIGAAVPAAGVAATRKG